MTVFVDMGREIGGRSPPNNSKIQIFKIRNTILKEKKADRFVHQLKLSIVENLSVQKKDKIVFTLQYMPSFDCMEGKYPTLIHSLRLVRHRGVGLL